MNSALIETAIGLVLAFALLSVVVSWTTEYIRRGLNNNQNRTNFLLQQLDKMLAGSDVQKVLSHPLVAVRDAMGKKTGINHVAGENLARVIIEYPSVVPPELQQLIKKFSNDAENQLKVVNAWVDQQFTSMTALFKKYQYRWSFLIGLVFAIVLNVDTLQMAQVYWKDPTLRAAVVETAKNIEQQELPAQVVEEQPAEDDTEDQSTDDQSAAAARDEALTAINTLLDTNLPIWWQAKPEAPSEGSGENANLIIFKRDQDPRVIKDIWENTKDGHFRLLGSKIAGWLITAWAVSRGADFWFNLLRKLTQRG